MVVLWFHASHEVISNGHDILQWAKLSWVVSNDCFECALNTSTL
jgi:hypothetical protein